MRRLGSLLVVTTFLGTTACGHDRPVAPRDGVARATLRSPASDPTPAAIELQKIGGYAGGGAGAAEVTAFDPVSDRLFVVNGALGTVDVLDLADPATPVRIATIDVSAFGASANGIAAHGGLVAVAIEGHVKTQPGTVAFYRATTLQLVSTVTVGALPDMLAFSPSGRLVVVANEGEPSDDYAVDPEGSVSVIDVRNANAPTVRTAGFAGFDGQASALRARGVRIFGPGASVAQDLEPEYVAIADDERTAWVTLQENNALAIVDLDAAVVRDVVPLGYKDHALPANAFDASDRDGPSNGAAINIRPWPVLGMYQPDAIAAFSVQGQTYLVTANEGDARGWSGFSEEARAGTLPLNAATYSATACGGSCTSNARLGRLTVTTANGRNPGTGLFDTLYVFGARSISIRRADGSLLWDSGDALERLTSSLPNVRFNAGHENNNLDDRSDNKGPEPEGVVTGQLGAKTFAFAVLERVGGIVAYDVTNPSAPALAAYVNSRSGTTGDLGPEAITFIPARQSPNKRPLLVVGHEISGTTAIYEVVLR